jgi:glucuronoarabinoxylan endo-1,4-beta-xylanase
MKLLLAVLLFVAAVPSLYAQSATINWNTTYQTIDGVGVSNYSNQGNDSYMNPYDNTLFNTLGVSLLRVGVTSSNGACTSVNPGCAEGSADDPGSSNVADAQYCNSVPGCRVFATPFSPPAAYMTNGSTDCTANGGNGTLISGDYEAYATWLSNFATSYSTYNGVNLYAISVQNEPDQCQAYPSALLTEADINTFIGTTGTGFGPVLSSANPSTLIMMAETSGSNILTAYAGTCMANASTCGKYVGVIAFHSYDNLYTGGENNPYSTSHYWMTEASAADVHPFSSTITDAMKWATALDNSFANRSVNAYVWYWGVCPTYSSGSGNSNGCLISATGTVAIRAYVVGQYAKFVRPGMVRIGTTRSGLASGITVSAYKNTSTNAFAVVATNTSSSPVSQQFTFAGFSPTSVQGTITSATQSMASLGTMPLSGGSFTYTLPAQSVITFYGSGTATNSSSNPVAPANLTVTVR